MSSRHLNIEGGRLQWNNHIRLGYSRLSNRSSNQVRRSIALELAVQGEAEGGVHGTASLSNGCRVQNILLSHHQSGNGGLTEGGDHMLSLPQLWEMALAHLATWCGTYLIFSEWLRQLLVH